MDDKILRDTVVSNKTLVKEHQGRLDKIDIVLDKVRNRPPVWLTFVFGALFAIIGYLVRSKIGS